MTEPERPGGPVAALVRLFLSSRLPLLLLLGALALGAAAIAITPREEEPQIEVVMADVMVQVPGASPKEVEKLVTTPLERILWHIEGMEHVYSVSRSDSAMATARFKVGVDRDAALTRLHDAINSNRDLVPPVVGGWVVKPRVVDDVPILSLALHSNRYSDHELERMAGELFARLAKVKNVSRVSIHGGRPREVRVELSPDRLAGFGVTPARIERALRATDASVTAGSLTRQNTETRVALNAFLTSPNDVSQLVVGVHDGMPVLLNQVADVLDAPREATSYTRLGFGARHAAESGIDPESRPSVTIAVAKKRGTNAVEVSQNVLREMERLKRDVLPDGVEVEVLRDFGRTADAKVNNLLASLALAVFIVVTLLAVTLGWREGLIVALAVPVSFSLALFASYLLGYTINRVTLFALILSLGLVVDDPITNVDNIQRHLRMSKGPLGPKEKAAAIMAGVSEVVPPVIMSTLAIIASFLPLFFITGMMGPYMAPMAANVPLTVTFSTLVSLAIVPWLASKLLPGPTTEQVQGGNGESRAPAGIRRFYDKALTPFLDRRGARTAMVAGLLVLLAGSASLALTGLVPLKMLPFDNKDRFQLVIDMDEGTPLEQTDAVVREFEDYLRGVPEVRAFATYAGISSPMDFNGMVRQHYLRRGGHVADIRVTLADSSRREMQSHSLLLRLRRDLSALAARRGAVVKLVEAPPGPPVMATLTGEVRGGPDTKYSELVRAVRQLKDLMAPIPSIVDSDTSAEAERSLLDFVPDKRKAALHGIATSDITDTLRLMLRGASPALVHLPDERLPLEVMLRLPREKRSSPLELGQIPMAGERGEGPEGIVPLAELGQFQRTEEAQPIYHKDLERVAWVYAEMAGAPPVKGVFAMNEAVGHSPLPEGTSVDWAGEGEWDITLTVFRDLGIAFAAALLGIYVLLTLETGSFFMPLLLMSAIPLTVIGILPGFWLLNVLTGGTVGGYADPVFFTATAMIGMIALGGIVIRNAVVLIDFIQDARRQGQSLREAVLDSGAVRLRPILLTAATTALGAWPITLDPIFAGLAWALIFGLAASTLFTLLVIPVAYYALEKEGESTRPQGT